MFLNYELSKNTTKQPDLGYFQLLIKNYEASSLKHSLLVVVNLNS